MKDCFSCINTNYYMKDKNLLDDIKNKSLNELTELANNIIERLENEKNLELLINDYQKLIKLNNLIERKFQNTSREISQETRNKINLILNKKNGKKT